MTDQGSVPPPSSALPRGRRLGVDVGTARIGVAVSDPDGLIATPVVTVPRDKDPNGTSDVAAIANHYREHAATVVYVGLPRHMNGTEGASAADARAFAQRLVTAGLAVRLVDERLTTVTAAAQMHQAGRKATRQRSVIDQQAAVIILQTALDAERARGHRPGELVGTD